jgi:hypothetical protein
MSWGKKEIEKKKTKKKAVPCAMRMGTDKAPWDPID